MVPIPELQFATCEDGVPDPAVDRPVQVWQDDRGAACAFGYQFGAQCWLHFPGLACFKFSRDHSEVIGVPEPDADQEAIADTYFRSVTPLVLQVRGLEALHASAIRSSNGIVALCGVSGTGKSTLAFALRRRGYGHWGDDAVVFRAGGRRATAVPIPFTPRLHGPAVGHFGIAPEPRNSSPCLLRGGSSPVPLASICILERRSPEASPSPVRMERLSAAAAFPALLQHAYCFSLEDQGRKRSMLRAYLELAATVPAYRVSFVPGLDYLPRIEDEVEALLQPA